MANSEKIERGLHRGWGGWKLDGGLEGHLFVGQDGDVFLYPAHRWTWESFGDDPALELWDGERNSPTGSGRYPPRPETEPIVLIEGRGVPLEEERSTFHTPEPLVRLGLSQGS